MLASWSPKGHGAGPHPDTGCPEPHRVGVQSSSAPITEHQAGSAPHETRPHPTAAGHTLTHTWVGLTGSKHVPTAQAARSPQRLRCDDTVNETNKVQNSTNDDAFLCEYRKDRELCRHKQPLLCTHAQTLIVAIFGQGQT